MRLEFSGEVFHWRGPAPHHFITVPEPQCAELAEAAPMVSYGWGMIPVAVRIGETTWRTSLFPKNGAYLLPLRADVRRAEALDIGDTASVLLDVDD